ncbi:MAG: efflux RND transporter periplasmic adaptor subunit [Burkholderiales bacterium]|nr:efflux RND transporter periplasmic adaptor subunit [Burkholderiales bacterium]
MRTLIVLSSILLVAVLLTACENKSNDTAAAAKPATAEPNEPSGSDSAEEMARVVTETVAEHPTEGRIVVTATVHQDHHLLAQVVPRVPGRVLQVLVHVGDPVKRGQTLAILDSLDVGDARLTLRQARIQSDLAETEYARIAQLVEEEVLPRKELIRATAERNKARAGADTAAQRLRLLGVDPEQAQTSAGVASSFPIVAPLAGLVLEKTAIVGELATSDKPLFTISDLSNIWVEGNLADRQIGLTRIGAPAEVSVDAYPGEIFHGKVTYLAGTLDPATRTLLARVEIANRDLRLKPQMFARMAIATGESKPQLTVPKSAVILVQGESSVFVADGDGFTPRPVETGEVVGDRIVILRGLNVGDRVAIGDVFDLKAKLLKSQISDEH